MAHSPQLPWLRIWDPKKVKVFLWPFLHESIPTALLLHHRHLVATSSSFRCSPHVESCLHMARDCPIVKHIWLQFPLHCLGDNLFSLGCKEWLLLNCRSKKNVLGIPWVMVFSFAIWLFWYWSNCQLFVSDFLWMGGFAYRVGNLITVEPECDLAVES